MMSQRYPVHGVSKESVEAGEGGFSYKAIVCIIDHVNLPPYHMLVSAAHLIMVTSRMFPLFSNTLPHKRTVPVGSHFPGDSACCGWCGDFRS